MKRAAFLLSLWALLLGPLRTNAAPKADSLSDEGRLLLKVAAGIQYTFQHCAAQIWPGYDLSQTPYLLYLPDEFVLYLNPPYCPMDFSSYPQNWPFLGAKACLHLGNYPGLSGLFSFDFEIDSAHVFAMSLPREILRQQTEPALTLLRTTVHEGFHAYQTRHFGEIPWAREEQYPILDVQNSALAALELQILQQALKAMFEGHLQEMKERLRWFVAVRFYRWQKADPFVKKYEQGQEINEGTARYVEMKTTACLLKLLKQKPNIPLLQEFKKEVTGLTIADVLFEDLNRFQDEGAIAPQDMLRNRIYPLGAALGFLLDTLHIRWKDKFQQAGTQIAFHRLLARQLSFDSTKVEALVQQVKSHYHFEKILDRTQSLIKQYFSDYRKAWQAFKAQPGLRIELDLPSNGLQRFRSSDKQKWVIDRGQIVFCPNYHLYLLQPLLKKNFQLELHEYAVWEHSDWPNKRKQVQFVVDHLDSLLIDGQAFDLDKSFQRSFSEIVISGPNFYFWAKTPGMLELSEKSLKIILRQAGRGRNR